MDRCCPRARFVNGPARLTNRDSREALKNLPSVVMIGWTPTRARGATVLMLRAATCLCMICLTCDRFTWTRFRTSLLMACRWWPLKRLTLLILICVGSLGTARLLPRRWIRHLMACMTLLMSSAAPDGLLDLLSPPPNPQCLIPVRLHCPGPKQKPLTRP